jgi:hypothetical protein
VRLRTTLIALCLVALLVAGCGGGGDETTESTAEETATTVALTKAELLERGDAICAEVNAAVGSAAANAEGEGEPGQAAGLYAGMVESLKGIGTPQEADGYADFIAAADALATAEDEVQLASDRGDVAALESAETSASSALADFQAAADEYGFEECGEGPSAPSAVAPEAGAEEGGVEAEVPEAVEEAAPEEVAPEEVAPEPAPETGGAGGTAGEGAGAAPETGGGSSGGIGPG